MTHNPNGPPLSPEELQQVETDTESALGATIIHPTSYEGRVLFQVPKLLAHIRWLEEHIQDRVDSAFQEGIAAGQRFLEP